jgi:hypothetical protein
MKQSLKALLLGKADPHLYQGYVFFVLGIYAASMIIAWTFFPIPYSMKVNDISDLGGWAENPDGYLWYNIPVIVVGLLMVSLMLFYYNGINTLNSKAVISKKMGKICTITSSISFSLHGIIPQDFGLIHRIIAYYCFIGVIVGAIFYYYATFLHFNTQPSKRIRYAYHIIFIWLYLSFFIMIFSIFIANLNNIPVETIYSALEWTVMLTMQAWMIGLTFLISYEVIRITKASLINQNIKHVENLN